MISVVIPCYNEGPVVRLVHGAVREAATAWNDSFELLLIDDGSRDDTWDYIRDLAEHDPCVQGIRLARNFGHQAAVGAGLEQAQGDAVVVLDADLQDPPELIAEMLQRWREGNEVVYAQRRRREGETLLKRFTAYAYYRLLSWASNVDIPRDTGDFALMDAQVVEQLVAMNEHAIYWRGLRSWTGGRQTAVLYDRPPRIEGEAKYSFFKSLRLACDGLLSFSTLPLRLSLYSGATVLIVSSLLAAISIASSLVAPQTSMSFPLGTLGTWFIGGVQLVFLGVVGEYLNRIYDEVRNRPRWIVSTTIGSTEDRKPQRVRLREAG